MDNNWKEWRRYILSTLEKLENRIEKVEDNETENKIEIIKINTKSKVYGTIAGLISSLIITVIAGLIVFSLTSGINNNTDINSNKPHKIEKGK